MVRRLLSVVVVVIGVAFVGTGITAGAPATGHVWTWGDNADGELGNGTITRYGGIATPGRITNLTGVMAVAGGSAHSLALRSDGTVWAWGSNSSSQLGTRTTVTCTTYQYTCSTVPVQVKNLTGVVAVAGGGNRRRPEP